MNEFDYQSLNELLNINTTTPMETSVASQINEAQQIYRRLAEQEGCEVVSLKPSDDAVLNMPLTPKSVHIKSNEMGSDFWESQTNLLLSFGDAKTFDKTLCFNFHMDTVEGGLPANLTEDEVRGRGIVDAKGLGFALLMALKKANQRCHDLSQRIKILIQSVSGEEGGAMGVYGTRTLKEQGHCGRLNVVLEPTGFKYVDQSTTSMTLEICVNAQGSTDDAPEKGVNSTIILSSFTDYLMTHAAQFVQERQAKMCIAGLHTGAMHNRVYGEGRLLVNFAYQSLTAAGDIKRHIEKLFLSWQSYFVDRYQHLPLVQKTASALSSQCKMSWLKSELPVLSNCDDYAEEMLQSIGIKREEDNSRYFTCDAMWLEDPRAYTIILGPGDLGDNLAHTDNEFIKKEDYEQYIDLLADLIIKFAKTDLPMRKVDKNKLTSITDLSNPSSEKFYYVDSEALLHFYKSLLPCCGFGEPETDIISQGLFYSDIYGLDTHGVVNLVNIYMPLIEKYGLNCQAIPQIITDSGGCVSIDAKKSLGYIAGHYGMKQAIEKAKQNAIGCSVTRNSTHAGSLGYFTKMAREANMIGLAFTNLGKQGLLPPTLGKTPLLGTNVLAASVPGSLNPAFNLDMSTAVVSSGRIKQYARKGLAVPQGWLRDKNGNDCTSADAYLDREAFLNFLGGSAATSGYKGYGLALLIDILCGSLSGASVGPSQSNLVGAPLDCSTRDYNIGLTFIALNIGAFADFEAFTGSVDNLLSTVLASDSIGSDPVVYPGYIEHNNAQKRAKEGIPVEVDIYQALIAIAKRYSINPPKFYKDNSNA